MAKDDRNYVNEILGNYTKKEDQLMTAAFGTRPKRMLNRVMDALNFEYPDYERLDERAGGTKRKRVVSILSKEVARSVKADEKALKKVKATSEPKAQAPKKRKLDEIPSAEPKVDEAPKETLSPSSPIAAEVAKILKVMTESPPFKLISPLRSELTNLLQKMKVPSATEEKVRGLKKWRIVNVMQAIEQKSPSASAVKGAIPADTKDAGGAEAEELTTIMSKIDKLILDVVAKKTGVVCGGKHGHSA
jgi:IS30 family transposase